MTATHYKPKFIMAMLVALLMVVTCIVSCSNHELAPSEDDSSKVVEASENEDKSLEPSDASEEVNSSSVASDETLESSGEDSEPSNDENVSVEEVSENPNSSEPPSDSSDESSEISDESTEISEKPEHTHNWKAATCTSAKTCKDCGEIEGSAKGHNWKAATCTSAKTCKTCGKTEGSAKGHNWKAATCTSAKTCKTCGKTQGSAKGHKYADGKCTACSAIDPSADTNNKKPTLSGESPVAVIVNGKDVPIDSPADAVEFVEETLATLEKGETFVFAETGTVLTSNGDGSYTDVTGYVWSPELISNTFKNKWCRLCEKRKGDGSNGTCMLWAVDNECPLCGELCKKMICHTCAD